MQLHPAASVTLFHTRQEAMRHIKSSMGWQPYKQKSDLNFLRECSTEHQSLPSTSWRHRILLNDTSDLRLKAHVQHTISFIQHQITAHNSMARWKKDHLLYKINNKNIDLINIDLLFTMPWLNISNRINKISLTALYIDVYWWLQWSSEARYLQTLDY